MGQQMGHHAGPPSQKGPPLQPADEPVDDEALVSAVLMASRALVAIAARSLAAAPAHVTVPQYRLLVLLASRGPQTPSAIATDLGAAPSSVTRLCDRLVAKGLIARRPSTGNRREVTLSISAAGRRVVDAVTRVRRGEIERVVRAVPTGRRASVIEALNDLGSAAGEVPDPLWRLGWE
jgi:DNA-binding MarR family transcriptional regulator